MRRQDGSEKTFDTPGKVAGEIIREGESVVLQSAGGGGYGDPLERTPAQVAADVEEGFVSPRAARLLYGVVLDGDGRVDPAATLSLRGVLLAARQPLTVVAEADSFRAGRVSRSRLCRLNPDDAARLRLHDDAIVELDSGRGAALRAWVMIDGAVAKGAVPLDARGQSILACGPGGKLYLRRLAYGTPAGEDEAATL